MASYSFSKDSLTNEQIPAYCEKLIQHAVLLHQTDKYGIIFRIVMLQIMLLLNHCGVNDPFSNWYFMRKGHKYSLLISGDDDPFLVTEKFIASRLPTQPKLDNEKIPEIPTDILQIISGYLHSWDQNALMRSSKRMDKMIKEFRKKQTKVKLGTILINTGCDCPCNLMFEVVRISQTKKTVWCKRRASCFKLWGLFRLSYPGPVLDDKLIRLRADGNVFYNMKRKIVSTVQTGDIFYDVLHIRGFSGMSDDFKRIIFAVNDKETNAHSMCSVARYRELLLRPNARFEFAYRH